MDKLTDWSDCDHEGLFLAENKFNKNYNDNNTNNDDDDDDDNISNIIMRIFIKFSFRITNKEVN